jgi:hypothetical protein
MYATSGRFSSWAHNCRPITGRLGAQVQADYRPERVTLADIEGNEFCAFIDPDRDGDPPARAFAVCTDDAHVQTTGVSVDSQGNEFGVRRRAG